MQIFKYHIPKIFENIFFLTLFQASNYVLPIITLPYLVRIFGPEKYGVIIFAQAFIQYFSIITDYGFNLSATKEISIHRANASKVIDIFQTVMFLKIILMIICFCILLIVVTLVPKFIEYKMVYFAAFTMVLGNVLFPIWFFQGLEKLRTIILGTVVIRIIITVSTFVFVKNETDVILAILIQNSASIITGVLCIVIIYRMYNITFTRPSIASIKEALSGGLDLFISTIAVGFYTTSNIVVLGLLTNDATVGVYGAAEKLIRSILAVFSPISQAIYPHISSLVSQSQEIALQFIKRILKIIGILSMTVSCVLFLFSKQIVLLFLGPKFYDAIILVRIMSFLPFIVSVGIVFGMQTLVPFGLSNYFRKAISIGGLFNIIAIFPLTIMLNASGVAISYVVAEIVVAMMMYIYLYKKGYKLI